MKWILWLVSTLLVAGYFLRQLDDGRRTAFLPGATTSGHHQIEERCELCHTPRMGVKRDACIACHGEDLEAADDSHPRAKFQDPRMAELVEKLDARECTPCHVEHRPKMTGRIGLTLPADYCVECHADIGRERASHQGLSFTTCGDTGCHNFHDNRALTSEFLERHLHEPELRANASTTPLVPSARLHAPAAEAPDALGELVLSPGEAQRFAESAHHAREVGCNDCHEDAEGRVVRAPDATRCAACHENQQRGFERGKHGMRVQAALSPLRPALARMAMRPEAAQREVSCVSCHGAHDFDRVTASVESCLGCHDDEHSRAYGQSKHATLLAQHDDAARAVTCATCHMPSVEDASGQAHVEHAQTSTLRPRDEMARLVCIDCHGLQFSFDALADDALVRRNFLGRPTRSVQSLHMTQRALEHSSMTKPPRATPED